MRSENSRTQVVWDKAIAAVAKKLAVEPETVGMAVSFETDRVLAGERYVWAESANVDLLDRLEIVAMRFV